jgi:hypothetical protein
MLTFTLIGAAIPSPIPGRVALNLATISHLDLLVLDHEASCTRLGA